MKAADKRTLVYVLLSLLVSFLFWRDERHDDQIEAVVGDLQQVVRDIEAESARTDVAFCHTANANRRNGNDRAKAIRDAVSVAFAGQPDVLSRILSEIPPDLPLLDCSGIGDRKENFSRQPAIDGFPEVTVPTTTVP